MPIRVISMPITDWQKHSSRIRNMILPGYTIPKLLIITRTSLSWTYTLVISTRTWNSLIQPKCITGWLPCWIPSMKRLSIIWVRPVIHWRNMIPHVFTTTRLCRRIRIQPMRWSTWVLFSATWKILIPLIPISSRRSNWSPGILRS